MYISVSSVFITVIMTFLMITLFYVILSNKKLIFLLRSDLLIVLSFMIILRLLIPVEWPFTVTIPLPFFMNPLQSFLNYEILNGFSILNLLLGIWIIGSIYQTFRFIIQMKKINNVFYILEKTANKKQVSDYFDIDVKHNYSVWISNSIPFPMILGFKKIILLPELDLEKDEWIRIIQHEIEHLKHHDNVIKLFLNILLIIYWWFIPVYWLCNKIQLVLEMRVDRKVTKHSSDFDYAQTLLKVKKELVSKTSVKFNQIGISSTFYINDGTSTLSYRIQYLLESNYKKSTNSILILVIFLIPLISNSIILEPYILPELNDNTINPADELEDGFILEHRDGTYSLYKNGNIEKIDKPDDKLLSKYPIICE